MLGDPFIRTLPRPRSHEEKPRNANGEAVGRRAFGSLHHWRPDCLRPLLAVPRQELDPVAFKVHGWLSVVLSFG